jgi:hypothetical protein
MTVLTDRQRVEIAIPARLVFGVVAAKCFSDPDAEVVKRLEDLLVQACVEPIADLPEQKGIQVARRIERTTDAIAKDFDDQPAVKIAMALYYFLQDLLEREVLVLWEGSAFAEAMQILMPMFEHGFEVQRIDASAQKQARRLRERLEREGYYRRAA